MRIPASLRIAGRTWRVRYALAVRAPPGGPLVSGACAYRSRTIWLLAGQPQRELELAFVHELLHAILGRLGRYDEGVIRRLEKPLRGLLRDPRTSVRWQR